MHYHVEMQPPALRQLHKLDNSIRRRLIQAVEKLADDPRPSGCLKLSGGDNEYRFASGNIASFTPLKMNTCWCSFWRQDIAKTFTRNGNGGDDERR